MGVPTPQFSASSDGKVMLWHGHQPPAYVEADVAREAIGAPAEESVPRKNYIINGAMMVSQQNGSSAGTATAYYPVDLFSLNFSNGGTQTVQQVAVATPGGSTSRIRVTATVADASVAASDLCFLQQRIEGLRTCDLLLGSSSAKTITIRFGVKAPAGTYCVSLRNGGATRSYVAEYVIAAGEANSDVVKSVTIALDQSGTWAADNTTGVQVTWTLMCGATYQTTQGSWVAGNFVASANQFNFMGTASNVFELFDVSLTEGFAAPVFVVPDYYETLRACQRYWRKIKSGIGMAYSANAARFYIPHEGLRATPTASVSGAMSITNTHSANYTQTSANLALFSAAADYGQYDFGNFVGLTSTQPQAILPSSAGFLILDARM